MGTFQCHNMYDTLCNSSITKQFIGKDILEIRKLFGDFTGHYFVDISPTYIVGGVNSTDTNTWQLVFLINHDEKILDIILHKNCCDR